MSNATPAVSKACVMPGALFMTNVSIAQTTSITIARMSQGSIISLTSTLRSRKLRPFKKVDGRRAPFFSR
jgi:hypothetical protein